MPTYCYTNHDTGKTITRVFPVKERPEFVTVGDEQYRRDFIQDAKSQGRGYYKPRASVALAVHPSQSRDFERKSGAAGCFTKHDKRGRPVFYSKSQRTKYCEWRGATDFDGGYGDPTTERGRHG